MLEASMLLSIAGLMVPATSLPPWMGQKMLNSRSTAVSRVMSKMNMILDVNFGSWW